MNRDEDRRLEKPTKADHPAWRAFIRYCAEMRHGELERVRIQDGLPVLAELTRTKIKFTAE